ncbi:aminoglycoside adenylyltransferase [Streptomyces sp. NBC_00264]|uniref:nucleotidyltransferase domain-containing protein n=1 Tax=unclassified Streptomyces TaxID=2593676 RepID=UPI000F5BF760|nr:MULTISPECIES: aminoglycoside adenylyltransferase [unclassified Streptomyces]WSG56247.1 aminoglycoside adenylyltransferase [Streptomyces sp. NBC_01732]WSX07414.1 aminoglycoside adenylyltransferase [Streptomyces sp. NBC_00987]MCX4399691.1 aminoglycoside adenylyltransferase [Streptomyces sp. NBC_01767]MCX5165655.1 aminoglycoside adenylyltransferase [Streptomyces sp. NBC_00305]MCX5224212.1 aminoglycoside adenylyltransferase [Streptomyces sp. NBC_00264]
MGRADQQLRLIAEAVEVAGALEVPVWLRGGWAMDFFLGEITRDHEDIDWFTWADDAGDLARGLLRHGYEPVPGSPPDLQLDFLKNGLESSFTLLDRDRAGRVVVAGGPWAGAPWPEGMLDAGPGRIGGLQCAIVGPRAQIEIKRMTPVWDPSRPRRTKDTEDIARLEAALRAQGETA